MEYDSLNYNLPYLGNKQIEITLCQKIQRKGNRLLLPSVMLVIYKYSSRKNKRLMIQSATFTNVYRNEN